jgi:hypothetical protein
MAWLWTPLRSQRPPLLTPPPALQSMRCTVRSTKARTGLAIINDLLNVARGWLSITAAGAWAIVQDVA